MMMMILMRFYEQIFFFFYVDFSSFFLSFTTKLYVTIQILLRPTTSFFLPLLVCASEVVVLVSHTHR